MNFITAAKARLENFFAPTNPAQLPQTHAETQTGKPIEHRTIQTGEEWRNLNAFKAIPELLDSGQEEEALKEQLKTLCEGRKIDSIPDSTVVRNLEVSIANRIYGPSVTYINRYGKQTGADGRKYERARQLVEENYAFAAKYKDKTPEEQFPNVSQKTAVKTLLVVTELILDYNKLHANKRYGTDYTDADLSVMEKSDNVDKIFADAEAVFI